MKASYKHLPESFFHFLWKYRLFSLPLKGRDGENIEIISPGMHNHDAGPDFLYARVRIADTLWAGNVEIHVRGSDWYRHGHDKDPAYNNVILHVVAEDDLAAKNHAARDLQTLCLSDKFSLKLLERYKEMNENLSWVPCMKLIHKVEPIRVMSLVHAMAIQRLEEKAQNVALLLRSCMMDWEECCYIVISKQFGAKINSTQFEMLSKTLPVRILMKYHKDLFRIESLLFGQSGLLHPSYRENYPRKLKKEYRYLAELHQLTPMPGYLWKFLRLRPAAFPSLRIAQLARLYERNQSLLQVILEAEDLSTLVNLFSSTASDYWDTHYVFGKKSGQRKKVFGKNSIQLLLINAVIPLLHLYGSEMNKPELCHRAVSFLEALPPENNAVIRRWKDTGIHAINSLETQGLLQLKSSMCDKKRCLDCTIGLALLRQRSSP